MISIQHKRKAFKYAGVFLQKEISSIEESLTNAHLLDNSKSLLEERLSELKMNLEKLEQ